MAEYTPELVKKLTEGSYEMGYLQGQFAMRERAAVVAEKWYDLPDVEPCGDLPTVEKIVGRMIRALQPEESAQ